MKALLEVTTAGAIQLSALDGSERKDLSLLLGAQDGQGADAGCLSTI